ncbi:MAG: ABC transporter substrate-binding protein [Anaerolineales bacterium]|nr:ABC transporter substrate-binding protein [Anaerolineales bacterium]
MQACAGAATTPAATQPSDQSTGAPPATAPAEQPTTGPAATRAGVFRVAVQPIVQTDPANISSDPEVVFAGHVYDYLVDITPENIIAPHLATTWTTSQDGLTYVFSLAEGVTFHDGTAFSAQDVVWTFNRLRDPDSGLPTADLYSNIAGIQATGDLEVTFTLQRPNPFFLFDLSDNHALVVQNGVSDATQNFNGTGPFKVTQYSPEDRMELEANPAYFVAGQPKLAGLELIFFNDQTAMVEALRGGQVDLVMALSTDLYSGLEGEPGLTLVDVPTNQFDLVRLRSDRAPGDDPRVMQALKLATDREAIFQLVQQGFGRIGRDSPIGPLYTQYYSEDTPLPTRDVAAARALLAEAGYEDGLQMDLHTPDTGNRPNLAVVLKEQWAEAGVDVNVVVEPESVYYGDDGWLEVDLGITGWGSRPYPQFYFDVMLTCDAVWNESHYCNPEFDALVETAGTSLDEQVRTDAYHQIQRILLESGPVMIPYFYTQLAAVSDQFQGFELKAFSGRSDFRGVSVAP